jgi:hypothetical protein
MISFQQAMFDTRGFSSALRTLKILGIMAAQAAKHMGLFG